MIDPTFFNGDYYERGLESGKSCYQNYRWIPELTVPLAMTIIDFLNISRGDTVLDYGCAKGYLVKAMRLLARPAWGLDVSKYAIDNVHPEVKQCCFLKNRNIIEYPDGAEKPPTVFDYVIAKDVFEHIPHSQIVSVLNDICGRVLFVVVPLGDGGIYRASANNLDKSHVTCLNEQEWVKIFSNSKWKLQDFNHRIDGIKDSYYERTPTAHGFYTLTS